MRCATPSLALHPSWLILLTGWPHPEHTVGTVRSIRSLEPCTDVGWRMLSALGEKKKTLGSGERSCGEAAPCPAFTSVCANGANRAAPGTGALCPGTGCKRVFASAGPGPPRPSWELWGSVAATACSAPWAAPAWGWVRAGEARTAHTIPRRFPGSFSCRCAPSRCSMPDVPQFPPPAQQCGSPGLGKPR